MAGRYRISGRYAIYLACLAKRSRTNSVVLTIGFGVLEFILSVCLLLSGLVRFYGCRKRHIAVVSYKGLSVVFPFQY